MNSLFLTPPDASRHLTNDQAHLQRLLVGCLGEWREYAREPRLAHHSRQGASTHTGDKPAQPGLDIGDVLDRSDPETLDPYHNSDEFIGYCDPADKAGLLTIRTAR